MNAKEKERFITDLCDSVKHELISKIDRMPENWDGYELRELLQDKFEAESIIPDKRCARYREYRDTCLINNL